MNKAEQYIDDVINGRVLVNKFTKQAVDRHLADLKKGKRRGLYFNPEKGMHVIEWAESRLVFTKGKREQVGRRLELAPWQCFHLYVLFGWRKGSPDGPRRFRMSYLEIPRKNGKTFLASIVVLYGAFYDGEARAQVYTAATKRDQAKLCLKDAQSFVKTSPVLNQYLQCNQNSITFKRLVHPLIQENFVQSLSSDAGTQDGLDVHVAVVDELHQHPKPDLVDVITTATGARDQPLIYEITTAGVNKLWVCYQHREMVVNMLNGTKPNDDLFGMIYTLDDGDDPADENVWAKANPNLGTGKSLDYMRSEWRKATNSPSYKNTVLRYDFNIWTGAHQQWMEIETWRGLNDSSDWPQSRLMGCDVYAGLDLAKVSDFTALSLLFVDPSNGEKFTKQWFWLPDDTITERSNEYPSEIFSWVDAGYLRSTPGNVTDDIVVADDIIDICRTFNVHSMSFDRYLAGSGVVQSFMREFGDDFVNPLSQTMSALHPPLVDLEKDITGKQLRHDGNPVMEWMVQNVVIKTDMEGNYKMDKGKSVNKIDGPASLVFAYAEYKQTESDLFQNGTPGVFII